MPLLPPLPLRTLDLDPLGTGPWAAPCVVPAGAPPASAEVIVVGTGVTGLSAALTLAAEGLDVTAVDMQFGRGATSRSGGIVLGDTLEGPAPGFHHCEQVLGRWIEGEGVDCGFRWVACLELERRADLPAVPIDWRDAGRVRVAASVPAGVLDPVQLLNGMLSSTTRAGAKVVSGVRVRTIEAAGDRVALVTDTGRCVARQVVLATDAISWVDDEDPWPERTLTVALRTEALPADTVAAIGLQPHQPFYTRELPLLWGRPLPDGSFMFGRELVAFPREAPADEVRARLANAAAALTARVRALHPRLAHAEVGRTWAGPTARAAHGRPAVMDDARLAGAVWAGGYGGHGLAQAFTVGRRAAGLVLRRLRAPITSG